MNKYIFEFVVGDNHHYICAGQPVTVGEHVLNFTTKRKLVMRPQPRNAMRIEGFKESKKLLDQFLTISPTNIRKLVGVDKDWDRPIIINMRRDDESTKLIDCVAAQRMYTFKEQE